MKTRALVGLLVAALMLAGCTLWPAPPLPDTRAGDEAAIRALIDKWAQAARARDAATFVSFFPEDAVLMLEDAPTSAARRRSATGSTA